MGQIVSVWVKQKNEALVPALQEKNCCFSRNTCSVLPRQFCLQLCFPALPQGEQARIIFFLVQRTLAVFAD